MRLTWLADVLRAAGVQVVEVDGWRTRGRGDWGPIRGVVFHATADKANSGPADARDDAGAIAVIRDGRPGLSGPIAVAYVNREGVWHVIAAGRCNTVKTGWAGPLQGLGNSSIVGVEAENDNKGEAWPAAQLDSLRKGFAAILRHLGLPVSKLAAHWEHQPGEKTDPHGVDMGAFRASVAAPPKLMEDRMLVIAKDTADGSLWLCDGVWSRPLADDQVPHVKYLASQGAIGPLWKGGEIWAGWVPAFGQKTTALDDALADGQVKLAEGVAAVNAAVAALRELVGAGGTDPQVIEDAAFRGAQRAERE